MLRQRIQKTRARPLISAALPEAVTTTHPRVWRAPKDSRAYVSTPPPALLRLLHIAWTTSQVPAPPRRAVPLKSSAVPIDGYELATTGINTKCDKHLALASGSGPVFGHEDRVPQSRAKPRVTPLVTISDWRYLLRRHHVTTPALWAGRLPLKGFLSSDRPEEFAGPSRHRTTRRAPARRRPGPAPIVVVGSRWRVGRPRSRFPGGADCSIPLRIPIFCERSLQCTTDARKQD